MLHFFTLSEELVKLDDESRSQQTFHTRNSNIEPNGPTVEVLMDLMPTEWRGYSSHRARLKEQYSLIDARCTLLRDEACTLSCHPEIAPELQALTLALQHLRHILDAQASEHLKLCSWLYLTYETEYDDYVVKHYSISNISDERLLDKLKRARRPCPS
jgi:hypothetical protein